MNNKSSEVVKGLTFFYVRHCAWSRDWTPVPAHVYAALFGGQMGHPNGTLLTNFQTVSGWEGGMIPSLIDPLVSGEHCSALLAMPFEEFIQRTCAGTGGS